MGKYTYLFPEKGTLVLDARDTPKGVSLRQIDDNVWVFSLCCDEVVMWSGESVGWACTECDKPPTYQPERASTMRAFYTVVGDTWGSFDEWIYSWTGLKPDTYVLTVT